MKLRLANMRLYWKEILDPNFTAIDDTINQSIGKYRDFLQATKIKKYQRDTEHYQLNQVYAWEGPRTGARRGRRRDAPLIGGRRYAEVGGHGNVDTETWTQRHPLRANSLQTATPATIAHCRFLLLPGRNTRPHERK